MAQFCIVQLILKCNNYCRNVMPGGRKPVHSRRCARDTLPGRGLFFKVTEGNMAQWRMSGTYFKSCNCDPGCPCDFMSRPTRVKCEGVCGMQVDTGHFDGVSLDGVKWAVAY